MIRARERGAGFPEDLLLPDVFVPTLQFQDGNVDHCALRRQKVEAQYGREVTMKAPALLILSLDNERPGHSGRLYRKISRRLIPLLFLSYLFAFLDRINVSYAQLQMKPMLGFTDAVYGLGAGVFFLSYVVFEMPSNLWMTRSGIRFTLLRIMLLWSLASAGTMFIKTPLHFYIARFLLGLFEAGFFPGVILYLTYWFPAARRGRVTTLFMLAIPVAGMIGGPLSGWIMSALNMKDNLAGWQWLLLLEGLPTSVLGLICFVYLPDNPSQAGWLNDREKAFLTTDLAKGADSIGIPEAHSTLKDHLIAGFELLKHFQVWALGFVYFAIACANYAFTFWLPTMLTTAGVGSISRVGLLSAIPYGVGIIGALAIARSSDLRGERRWHIAGAIALAALALGASNVLHSSIALTVLILAVAAFFLFGGGILFWAVPPTCFRSDAAPAAIATVSSIGVIGGFISPTLLGWIKTQTGRLDTGISSICVLMITAAVVLLLTLPDEPGVARKNKA
ncbi:MFS transporter [Tunturiibacter empetritectus]|uniref:MFS transporter n=1 Tax=Tunturiibacter empetritectus TaxID=3069691 RepID=UPI003D9BFD5D